ncbi:MAG TPA: TauD/TfdA family dioxygenase [Ideonella sp.]|nr:TauD/TfdA family dioxygenase [Ideonella sp.]
MAQMAYTPLPGGFGARVDFDPSRAPTPEQARQIAAIFHDHLFVYFAKADITTRQLAEFIVAFGKPDDPRGRLASAVSEYAGIRIVENVEKGKFGPRSNSELDWHSDRFYDPVVAGLLQSVIVPQQGGDTSLANMYRALAELPAELRQAIEGRAIKQDVVFDAQGKPGMRPGGVAVPDVANTPGVATAIIQTHPHSGRPYLYLGNRLNAHVQGLGLAASEDLLDRLFAHVNQPRFHYRHHWVPAELLMYDNRCCMHRRETFDVNADRKLIAAVVDSSDFL